jgi:hypothetical protein
MQSANKALQYSPFVSAPKLARSPVQAPIGQNDENAPTQTTRTIEIEKLSKLRAPNSSAVHKEESRSSAVVVSASTPIVLSEAYIETPSRRLAPREFQELMRHFKSPVDKQVFCETLVVSSATNAFIFIVVCRNLSKISFPNSPQEKWTRRTLNH